MPLPSWLQAWSQQPADYARHTWATPTAWDSSDARARSVLLRHAQFNPYSLPKAAIQNLELLCINLESGSPISKIDDQTLKQHKFYVDCRLHFSDPRFVAGYCNGEKVPFVFVKWNSSGFFHSHPSTLDYLRLMGADL
jgi:hypothetical protein